MLQYIKNEQHYTFFIEAIRQARRTIWIGTADIKDLYIKEGKDAVPLLKLLEQKVKEGVEVRLIHAKEPGQNFRDDFDKYPLLWSRMERVLCPRVHFKLLIFDLKQAYIGSANLTGAALGMKGKDNRNFEAGIFTSVEELVKEAVGQFDCLWMGIPCKTCKRKSSVRTGLLVNNKLIVLSFWKRNFLLFLSFLEGNILYCSCLEMDVG